MRISGDIHTWSVAEHSRRYAVLTLTYREVLGITQSYLYDAMGGLGEQRTLKSSHVKRLKKEMTSGTYTPAAISVGLKDIHKEMVEWGDDPNAPWFAIEVPEDEKLSLVDGGHRFAALGLLLSELEKEGVDNGIQQILNLPVTALIHLDGDTQRDFVNLQAGLNVDKAHMLSLRLQKFFDDPVMHLAFDICRALNEDNSSPFKDLVRFDSHQSSDGFLKQVPISSLCAKSASDSSTSCVGWAKVAYSFSLKAKDVVKTMVDAVKTIGKNLEDSLKSGMVLSLPKEGGTRGAATMLIGVGIVMTYRLGAWQRKRANDKDHALLVEAVKKYLFKSVDVGLSAPNKRTLMGEFARLMLADRVSEEELHDGLPRGLLSLTGTSTWDAEEMKG